MPIEPSGIEFERQGFPEPSTISSLLGRFKARTAKIAIIGLGYVGLPLLCAVGRKGFPVTGVDIDAAKIAQLSRGESYIRGVPAAEIAALKTAGILHVTMDFAQLQHVDAMILCVPTPLARHRDPDLTFVRGTAEAILPYLRKGQLVVLESTTYPGTTREVLRPILERGGLRSGSDFFLAYSPEREDPGNRSFATAAIPKIVAGDGPDALMAARTLYDEIVVRAVPVSSLETAEAIKVTENVFRAVNIALVNELKVIFEAMDINVWEVIDGAKTKPFGYMPFYPGPGLGGHCIPIDPFYLAWRAREFGIDARFVELAGEVNAAMPRRVVERAFEAMNRFAARAPSGSKVLLVGIAYKKNVDDTRESPAFTIIELLEEQGAQVSFYDPLISHIPDTRDHRRLAGRASIDFAAADLSQFAAAIICTDHDGIDYRTLVERCPLIVDTRNVCARLGLVGRHIVRA